MAQFLAGTNRYFQKWQRGFGGNAFLTPKQTFDTCLHKLWTWISMQSSNTESKRYFCKAWMWNGQIVSFGWFNVHRIGAEMRAFWRVSASLSQFWWLEVVRGVHVPRKIAWRIHFWGFLSSKMSILRATSIFHRTDACDSRTQPNHFGKFASKLARCM